MAAPFRLMVRPGPRPGSMLFSLAWRSPSEDGEAVSAPATLELGDGNIVQVGVLTPPTATTWRFQRTTDLLVYQYAGPAAATARLRWDRFVVQAATASEVLPGSLPQVALFHVKRASESPLQRIVELRVTGLARDRQVRLDAGAGQVLVLAGRDGADRSAEPTFSYSKPGIYVAALDLLDEEGFWLATLAETQFEIAVPEEALPPAVLEGPAAPSMAAPSVAPSARPADTSTALIEAEPWLPYRYARPTWSGARTYSAPGGGSVVRVVGAGVYLGIRSEAMADGALWYQTARGDWIAASATALFAPSPLRGVELGEPAPPPPPPPPADRQGIVTADVLNVRARPGVRPDNPPIAQLTRGTTVGIYEEAPYAGEVWYRIGVDRWVHSGYISLVGTPPAPPPEPPPPSPGERRGVVIADVLNVRARPGVSPDNPPVDRLTNGAQVTIYEETSYASEVWYRIGTDRWVHSGFVRVLTDAPTPTPTRRGVVTATLLNVRARPGVSVDNPPVGQLAQGAEVTIYEEAQAGGATWYRIGDNRWVHGGYIQLLASSRTSAASTVLSSLPVSAAPGASSIGLPVGWVVASSLNVRGRPGVSDDNPPIAQVLHNQMLPILEERVLGSSTWYRIGEGQWVEGTWVGVARFKPRPVGIGPDERWVGVNLQQQTAIAYEGDRPVYAALVATGMAGTPTVQGIFRTWRRLDTGVMAGPGYYIEDVTWTCYFYSGYALHTAYWHDAFGRPRSHGCVNLSPYDAWWIYRWSAPGGPNSPAVYVYWA